MLSSTYTKLYQRKELTETVFFFPVTNSWDDGLLDMCIGDKRKLTIPPAFAYGDQAVGPIPPKSTLGELSLFGFFY